MDTKEKNKEFRMENQASRSARKEEFRAKMATLKDERKKQILEKLSDKLERVYQRRVAHWRKVLARLTEVSIASRPLTKVQLS
jgi:hypothetical protein